MAHALRAPIGIDDYLQSEALSPLRHEYLGGHVHAMIGGSLRHNRFAGNLYARLLAELSGTSGQVFIHDVKLHVQAADCIDYPDLLVHCGAGPAGAAPVLTDAVLVAEVLSEPTAATDRREKRAACPRLPGLRVYRVISQDEQRAEVHERQPDGSWAARLLGAGDPLPCADLCAQPLPLAAAYAGTDVA